MVTMDDDGWWVVVAKSSVILNGNTSVWWRKCFLQFGGPTASSRRDVLHLIKNILPLLHSKDSSPGNRGDPESTQRQSFPDQCTQMAAGWDEIRKGFNTD